MKKLTLSIGLVAAMLSAKPQDTIPIKLDLTSKVLDLQPIYIPDNTRVVLWLKDKTNNTRKLTIYYPDGEVIWNILNSKDNMIVSPLGPFRLEIE